MTLDERVWRWLKLDHLQDEIKYLTAKVYALERRVDDQASEIRAMKIAPKAKPFPERRVPVMTWEQEQVNALEELEKL